MSDRKGRPESGPKKADTLDIEDGKMNVDSRKKNACELDDKKSSLSIERNKSSIERKKSSTGRSVSRLGGLERDKSTISLERQKSATGRKSATRLSGGVERDKSTLSLERQKSATGRKSATRLSNNSKNVRKFIGKIKQDKAGADDDEEGNLGGKKLNNEKIWDKEIEKLALRKKRVSMIDREIGLKQIRVIPPTPTIQNIGVRKHVEKKSIVQNALVMKSASPGAEKFYPTYKGPRYDKLGQIIPHSILGDVESFRKLSGQAAQDSNILLVHTSEPKPVRESKSVEENTSVLNPFVNQKNALNTWKTEMDLRCKEQNRLAGLLKCNERSLLMCKSETKADREIATILQHGDWRNHPDVCFWKLQQKFTAEHLHETLPKSSRGQLPTPVVSGDADTILQEKSKLREADLCKRFNDESTQERVESIKGTIQISNKVLFDKLLLKGDSIKSFDEAIYDNLEKPRGVRFLTENIVDTNDDGKEESADIAEKFGAIFSSFFGPRRMSKVVRDTRKLMKFKGISADQDEEVCWRRESGFRDRSKRRQSTYNDIVMSEKMSRDSKKVNRGVMDIRFVGLEKEELDGPALLIDGTTLQWCDCSMGGDNGCHGDGVIKEVFVLIKGEAGSIMRGYAKLENIGSTLIRYSWLRVPENKPLPVCRPRRRFFYFLDDDGVLLPREIVYVPMLFRSMIPGYFTESWLLSTQPQLEGGAKVKFTFKAIARYEPDFSKQFQEIEDYLRVTVYFNSFQDYLKMNEAQTVCSLQAQSILDYATLKASLAPTAMVYHPVEESMINVFMRKNPGLYYHDHIVRRLQLLCESFIVQSNLEKLENGDIVVSVIDLWKAFCALPDDDDDDCDDDVNDDCNAESYINLTRKQTLLWELYEDIISMSFQPILMIESSCHSKYILMYTLLQTGIDRVVNYTHYLADNLGLIPKKETKDAELVPKQEKGKTKGRASRGSKKSQTLELLSPAPTIRQNSSNEVLEFSAAKKFRVEIGEQNSPVLAKYDEKVYLEMYSMLTNTLDEMSVLFENM